MNTLEPITVRDIFAARAMSAILTPFTLQAQYDAETRRRNAASVARSAYEIADAMLAVRNQAPAAAPSDGTTTISPDCRCISCVIRRAIEQV